MLIRAGASIVSAVALTSSILIGCAGTLPEPIYANQVEEYFPDEPVAVEPVAEAPDAVPPDAVPPDGLPPDGVESDVTAPEPVPPDGVAETIAPETLAPEAVAAASFRPEAEQCAARMNEHRSTAEVVSIIQAIISGVGGAASGVGGALAAVDFGSPDITTAMGVMASIGAGVTLVGNLIIGFVANPLEELRRHGAAQRSWELAIELRYAGAPPEVIREMLLRCARDEAPPARAAPAGEPFTP